MNNYGSITRTDGTPLITPKVAAGLCVKNNILESFDFDTDQNGNIVENRACIIFKQSNGFMFKQTFMDGEADWMQEKLNRDIFHICNQMVSADEYNKAVEGVNNFREFITTVRDEIISKHIGDSFNLKITYSENKNTGKSYAGFPKIPNFIEPATTMISTFVDNPTYDKYMAIKPDIIPTEGNSSQTAVIDSPF